MAKAVAEKEIVKEAFHALPHLKRFPAHQMWIDYDEGADVLYISFDRPQQATNSVLRDDNVLLRYRGKKLVGLTIIGTQGGRHA